MRQLFAVFFYLLAGMFLIGFGMAALVIGQSPGESWFGPVATMALFALVPLAIGMLISPGARIREAGIVLLASGVMLGFAAAGVAMVTFSSGFRELMPPQAAKDLTLFANPLPGVALTVAMIALGLAMVLRKS